MQFFYERHLWQNSLMLIIEPQLFLLEFLFKRSERQLKAESVSILVVLGESVNIVLGVTGEFVILVISRVCNITLILEEL